MRQKIYMPKALQEGYRQGQAGGGRDREVGRVLPFLFPSPSPSLFFFLLFPFSFCLPCHGCLPPPQCHLSVPSICSHLPALPCFSKEHKHVLPCFLFVFLLPPILPSLLHESIILPPPVPLCIPHYIHTRYGYISRCAGESRWRRETGRDGIRRGSQRAHKTGAPQR